MVSTGTSMRSLLSASRHSQANPHLLDNLDNMRGRSHPGREYPIRDESCNSDSAVVLLKTEGLTGYTPNNLGPGYSCLLLGCFRIKRHELTGWGGCGTGKRGKTSNLSFNAAPRFPDTDVLSRLIHHEVPSLPSLHHITPSSSHTPSLRPFPVTRKLANPIAADRVQLFPHRGGRTTGNNIRQR